MKDWGDFRRLYEKVSQDFERLPYASRCMAADVLRRCDRRGRIIRGDTLNEKLVDDLAFMVRAHRGEELFLRECLAVLLGDTYLVFHAGYLTIRNFIEAQRPALSSAERMALKRARDMAAQMGDGPEPKQATGDESDAGASPGTSAVTQGEGEEGVGGVVGEGFGLVGSGDSDRSEEAESSGSPSDQPTNSGSRKRQRRQPETTASENRPVLMTNDWSPSPAQLEALATKHQVAAERLQAVVPEFRWYWIEGAGKGKRCSPRGWAQTFGNRVADLARRGDLYVEATPPPRGPSKAMPPGMQQHMETRRHEAEEERRRYRNGLFDRAKAGAFGKRAQDWAESGNNIAKLLDELEVFVEQRRNRGAAE